MHPFLSQCHQAVLDGDTDGARTLAGQALAEGRDLLETIERGFSAGIREAGSRWEQGVYFLPELAFSAEAMKAAMEILHPALGSRAAAGGSKGVVVIGTVQGDIHDIGKTLVATLLAANGFEVVDLGADVSCTRFVDAATEHDAAFVCMSALLTTTMSGQKQVIELLSERGLRDRVRVIVGGAPTSPGWARDIGADGHAASAAAAPGVLAAMLESGNG
jgi:corrinoid protein of di/trimethylamine methyltransferase